MKQHTKLVHVANKFLDAIGEDVKRDGLIETPQRFAKGYLEMLKGYGQGADYLKSIFSKTFETDNNSMVIESEIPVYSFCEHHILPFFGVASIGYIPKKRVVGLSKLVKVVDHFSRRLQIQEQLTQQIADAIYTNLDCSGVIVVLKCRHFCMIYRGVKADVPTTTSKVLGVFETDAIARQEFLTLDSFSSKV